MLDAHSYCVMMVRALHVDASEKDMMRRIHVDTLRTSAVHTDEVNMSALFCEGRWTDPRKWPRRCT